MRRVFMIAAAVFALQAAVTLGVFMHTASRRVNAAVQIKGDPQPLPGATSPLRVQLYNLHSGRAMPARDMALRFEGVDAPELRARENVRHAQLQVGDEPVVIEVDVEVDGFGRRQIRHEQTPADDRRWLEDRETWRRDASERETSASQDRQVQPRALVRGDDEVCGYLVSFVPASGVISALVDNRVYVRVTDEDGAPVSGVALSLMPPRDPGASARVAQGRTDSLGTAELLVQPVLASNWTLNYSCDAGAVARTIDLVPAWDGLALAVDEPLVRPRAPWQATISQQRDWGEWQSSVICDGHWLFEETHQAARGRRRVSMPELQVPGSALRLCALQVWIGAGHDPARSTHYFMLAPEPLSEVAAVAELVDRSIRYGRGRLRDQLGDATISALASADEGDRRRLARWLLSSLPQVWKPLPTLVDDRAALEGIMEGRRARTTSVLWKLLALDALILILFLAFVLVPSTIRQRRALIESMGDDDGDIDAVVSVRRSMFALIVGFATLLFAIAGMAILLTYLQ